MLNLSRVIIVFSQELIVGSWLRAISQRDVMTRLVTTMSTFTELLMSLIMWLLLRMIRSVVHGWNVVSTRGSLIRPATVVVTVHTSFLGSGQIVINVLPRTIHVRWRHFLSHRHGSALMCQLVFVSNLIDMMLLLMVHRQAMVRGLVRVLNGRRTVFQSRLFREWVIRLVHVSVVGSHGHGSIRPEVRLWLILCRTHGIFVRSHLVNVTWLYGIDLNSMVGSTFRISVVLIKMHFHHFILVLVW